MLECMGQALAWHLCFAMKTECSKAPDIGQGSFKVTAEITETHTLKS